MACFKGTFTDFLKTCIEFQISLVQNGTLKHDGAWKHFSQDKFIKRTEIEGENNKLGS